MMGALLDKVTGFVTPWLTKALAAVAAACVVTAVILYYRLDAEQTRNAALKSVVEEDDRTISTLRAQHAAASAVVEVLQDERAKDRAARAAIVQEIHDAPIAQNRSVPGVLPMALDGLRRTARGP